MGVDAENFLECIYESAIETKNHNLNSNDAKPNHNADNDADDDGSISLIQSVVKVELDEDRRVIEEMIQPRIEKILDAIYKEALHRKSESDLLAQYYRWDMPNQVS